MIALDVFVSIRAVAGKRERVGGLLALSAERTCRTIALIHEGRLAQRDAERVRRFEVESSHHDLAANLDGNWVGQVHRKPPDDPSAEGHVLAALAVTAGCDLNQLAVNVGCRDRETVQFGLDDEVEARGGEQLGEPVEPGFEFGVIHGVVE